MHTYRYNSTIGTFEIKEVRHEQYELWLGEELLGNYASAEFAAQDVANFNTDNPRWDRFKNELERFPATLREWSSVTEETPR